MNNSNSHPLRPRGIVVELLLAGHTLPEGPLEFTAGVIGQLGLAADFDIAGGVLGGDHAEGDPGVGQQVLVFDPLFQGAEAHVFAVPVEADGVGGDEAVFLADGAYGGHYFGLDDVQVGFGDFWGVGHGIGRCLGWVYFDGV